MSLADQFLSTAKDFLLVTETIKRLDSRVERVAGDVAGIDRRLMKLEIMVEVSTTPPRRRTRKELP